MASTGGGTGQRNPYGSQSTNWRNPYGSVNMNQSSWNMPQQNSYQPQQPPPTIAPPAMRQYPIMDGGGGNAAPNLQQQTPLTPTGWVSNPPPVSTKNVYYNGGIKTPEQMGMTPANPQNLFRSAGGWEDQPWNKGFTENPQYSAWSTTKPTVKGATLSKTQINPQTGQREEVYRTMDPEESRRQNEYLNQEAIQDGSVNMNQKSRQQPFTFNTQPRGYGYNSGGYRGGK